ncbi:MAG: YCF48-related protein, partial [Cyanobacteria bacterium J06638_22]
LAAAAERIAPELKWTITKATPIDSLDLSQELSSSTRIGLHASEMDNSLFLTVKTEADSITSFDLLSSKDMGKNWISKHSGSYDNHPAMHIIGSASVRFLQSESVIIAYPVGSFLLRSIDNGDSWNSVHIKSEDVFDYVEHISEPDSLIAADFSKSRILKSYDNGLTWVNVSEFEDDFNLRKLQYIENLNVITASGWRGSYSLEERENDELYVSSDGGYEWKRAEGLLGFWRETKIKSYDETLVLFQRDNGAAPGADSNFLSYSKDKGENWKNIQLDDQLSFPIRAMLVDEINNKIFFVGYNGLIAQSKDGGQNWSEYNIETKAHVLGLVRTTPESAIFAFGEDMTILKHDRDSDAWNKVYDHSLFKENLDEYHDLHPAFEYYITGMIYDDLGSRTIALGHFPGYLISTDFGESWDKVIYDETVVSKYGIVSGQGESAVMITGRNLLYLSSDMQDGIIKILESYQEKQSVEALLELKKISSSPPAPLLKSKLVASLFREINELLLQLGYVETARDEIIKKLVDVESGENDRRTRRDTFRNYINVCSNAAFGNADVATSCIETWADERAIAARAWWKTLAEIVPSSVLLLFLLVTLGGLYRYNLRLVGFHHSRADALELLSEKLAGGDVDSYTSLADALAADKVEFGKGNTPADQATEIAKAILSKKL